MTNIILFFSQIQFFSTMAPISHNMAVADMMP